MRACSFLLAVATGTSAWATPAQTPLIQVQRLRERPAATNADFASVLARDGSTLAVATLAQGSDRVTVFERSGGPWTEVIELSSEANDLALAAGLLYTGEVLGGSAGEVVVRARDQGGPNAWGVVVSVPRPAPPPPGFLPAFGFQVEVSGGRLFASDPQLGDRGFPSGPGRVWQIEVDAPSATWQAIGEVQTPPGSSEFGQHLAVDGDWMAASAGPRVWMLQRSGSSWVPRVLVTENLGSLAALELRDDRLVVGKPDSLAAESCVLVFERDLGGPGAWGLSATIPSPAGSVPYFGFSVALERDRLCVGGGSFFSSSGATAVYTFERTGSGSWQAGPVARPAGSMLGSDFGWALDLRSSSLLVGAPDEDVGGFTNAGALYVLRFAPIRPAGAPLR